MTDPIYWIISLKIPIYPPYYYMYEIVNKAYFKCDVEEIISKEFQNTDDLHQIEKIFYVKQKSKKNKLLLMYDKTGGYSGYRIINKKKLNSKWTSINDCSDEMRNCVEKYTFLGEMIDYVNPKTKEMALVLELK